MILYENGNVSTKGILEGFLIGLCIAGEARTFHNAAVRNSQINYVLKPLRAQGQLETFIVLGEHDRIGLNMTLVKEDFKPISILFEGGLSEGEDAANSQYKRLQICGSQFDQYEATIGAKFDWVVRLRPDLYFYGALPNLWAYSLDAVHARMRCFRFNQSFTEDHISAENQVSLRVNCRAQQKLTCRSCKQRHCMSSKSTVIDDQVALVPGGLRTIYFQSHYEKVRLCPPPHISECVLTRGITDNGVKISPLALYFTVARQSSKWHTSTSEHEGLFFDAPLVKGYKSTSAILRQYRCPF